MSEVDHLLPGNATSLERALSTIDGEQLALFPPQVLLKLLDPFTAPRAFLPAMAFQNSVEEEWDLAVTETQQRALIANAYALNAKKGTPFAIKRGLAVLGFPGATLVEGFPVLRHDASIAKRNGRSSYNSEGRWALFDVRLPISSMQPFGDAERLRVLRGIEIWQRAACYLRALSLATEITIIRESDAAAVLRVHIGLHLSAHRDTPRDGRFRRAGLRRYRYDGLWSHDAVPARDGSLLPLADDVLRFGVQQVDPHLVVHLQLKQDRPPSLRFDRAIRRDGSYARGYTGALMRQPGTRTGIGGLYAVAERASLRDGAITFDGAVRRGAGVPTVRLSLRGYRQLRHNGALVRGGQTFDGTAPRTGALLRGPAARYSATSRLTASVS